MESEKRFSAESPCFNQVAQLFLPKENIDKMAAEISGQAPLPIAELGIETDMLDYYCKLFGKK